MPVTSSGSATFADRPFNAVKVFSATMVSERDRLGERVTEWLGEHADVEVCEIAVTQSSDESFHCITLTVFYVEPTAGRP